MNDRNEFKFTPSVWIIPCFLTIAIWIVFYCENVLGFELSIYGITPRTLNGLIGVFVSPFLHEDLNHILSNTFPLFVLTTALIYFYRNQSLKVLLFGIFFSGMITWLIGRNSIHIGASSLIYVLFSFIFVKGFLTKYYRLMALSLTVISVYGGMVWYIFPSPLTTGQNSISWEGHLAGMITGVFFAFYYKTPDYVKETYYDWQQPDFKPEEDAFMKRFDDNGNFVNPPVPIENELEKDDLNDKIEIIYHFKDKES